MRILSLIVTTLLFVSDLNGQIAYKLIMGVPVCFDSISGRKYSFDSGSGTFLFSPIQLDRKSILPSFRTDATGHSAFMRKVKCNLNIAGVARINKNIPGIITDTSCLGVNLILGMDLFSDKTIHYINDLHQIDFNSTLPEARRPEFIVMDMIKPFLGNKYFLKLNWEGKARKLIIDTGFNGEVLIGEQCNLENDKVYSSDVAISTLYKSNKFIQIQSLISNINYNDIIFRDIKIDYVPAIKADVIGAAFFLKFKEVFFDFKNKEVWVSRELLTPHEPREIYFTMKDETITISFIDHRSCFYKNVGLRIGDTVEFKDQSLMEAVLKHECEVNDLFYNKAIETEICDSVFKAGK